MAFVNLTDMTIAINDTPKKIIFFMLKNYSFLSYLYFILLYITPIFNNTWGFQKNIFLGGCFFAWDNIERTCLKSGDAQAYN